MAILSTKEILAADDITEQEVSVPQWGGEVVVRSISYRTMSKIKNDVAKKYEGDDEPPEDEVEKWILIKGMINPEITEEEYEHLIDKNASAVMKVMNAILGSSKSDKDDVIKEAEKNFPPESE